MSARILAWSPGALGPLLADDGGDLSWQDAALCAQADPDAWYPEKGGSVAQPKAVCRRCPVRAECLEFALEHNERFGVWGGTTERQRRPMLAARERESGAVRCASGHHVLTGANLLPNGKCAACRDGVLKGHESRRLAKELAA